MSEDILLNFDTNKAQIVQFDTKGIEYLGLRYEGELNIITSNQMKNILSMMERMQTLEEENEKLKEDLTNAKRIVRDVKNKLIEVEKDRELWKKRTHNFKGAFEKEQAEHNSTKTKLQTYMSEYEKLKSFKAQQGRGRTEILTTEQKISIKNWALQGHSAKQIHHHLFDRGITVSYETVRKIVAEVKQQGGLTSEK